MFVLFVSLLSLSVIFELLSVGDCAVASDLITNRKIGLFDVHV